MKRKGRKEKVEQQNDDDQNGVEEKSSDPKNSSEEEAKNSEGDAEPEPEAKRRKSDKRKSAANNKKAAKKEEEESSEEDAQYEVERVLEEKMVRGVRHYLIRWKGYEPESDSWEPESTLNCPELIKKFRDQANEENGAEPAKKAKKSEKDKPKKEKKLVKKESKPEVNWESDDEFEVGSIVDVYFKKNGKREFLVSWKGYSHAQDSWEPEENLECTDLINKFMNKVETAKKVGKKELRVHRTPTERFTLNMSGGGRKLSRRLNKKQRVQYHEAE